MIKSVPGLLVQALLKARLQCIYKRKREFVAVSCLCLAKGRHLVLVHIKYIYKP